MLMANCNVWGQYVILASLVYAKEEGRVSIMRKGASGDDACSFSSVTQPPLSCF